MGSPMYSVVIGCILEDPGLKSRQAQEIIPYSKTSRQALRLSHPSIQRTPVALSCRRGVWLIAHLNLKLWLKMCGDVTPRPICDPMACIGTNLSFSIYMIMPNNA
jgi:hypothetical protein